MPTRSVDRSNSDIPGHSIAAVAARTGLSPDVLRVWERRYGAVAPTRSAGNQRLYSEEDIVRFQLLAAATSFGRSIRTVASLSSDALEILVAEDERAAKKGADASAPSFDVDALEAAIALTVALDGSRLDRMLRRTIALNGLPAFLEVDAPALMLRVGDDWEAGRLTVAQEHLASAVVLSILVDTVRSLPTAEAAPRLLVATLPLERHAVGAALAAAVAAMEGWAIVQLGVDVPSGDIARAAGATGARAVALSIVHDADRAHVLRELTNVRSAGDPGVPVFVGGATAIAMNASLGAVGATVCRNFSEFRAALAHESARAAGGVS